MQTSENETTFPCFMVEDGPRWIGYYRQRVNVDAVAATLSEPVITPINPPERIACVDDAPHEDTGGR